MHTIEIVTVGDELVEGRLVDTNSAFLSDRLMSVGLSVSRHTSVADDPDAIADVLRQAAGRADAVLVSGGLGPTTDDLTARCAATAFELPIELHPQALEHVEQFFVRRGRPMPENNRQQAELPAGCTLLPNPNGTAVGFALELEGCSIAFLPGVPRELEPMFEQHVEPTLRARFAAEPAQIATLKVFGLGESDVGARLAGLEATVAPPGQLTIQYRASFPEIHVRLRLRDCDDEETLQRLVQAGRDRLGASVYAVGGDQCTTTLGQVVSAALGAASERVALAESLSAGRAIALLADGDGLLPGVAGAEVSPFGQDEALNRAWGVRSRFDATLGCAVTGSVASGLVRVAIAGGEDPILKDLTFPIDADRLRTLAAHVALARLLRRVHRRG
jgi:competence/damage-inducible protein CinA-like protein